MSIFHHRTALSGKDTMKNEPPFAFLPSRLRRSIWLLAVIWMILPIAGCSSDDKGNVAPPEAEPPVITSPAQAEATGGLYFHYQATAVGEGGEIDSLIFVGYPDWLTPDADSIFGAPPDGLGDTTFTVIAFDKNLSDTLSVTINMIPCILVYGDTRTGHTVHQALVDSMVLLKPAAVFHTGDLVDDGTLADRWVTFNNITAALRAESDFFPALGNHEKQSQLFFDNFELPNNEQWYSVERNNTHFIILNSCVDMSPLSEQYQWLMDDLDSIDAAIQFRVVIFHQPLHSTGRHGGADTLEQLLAPIFEQHHIDMVFNGHDHDYERSYCNGIYYIVAGGSGAPLYDQAGTDPCSQLYLKTHHFCKLSMLDNRLVVKAYDLSGQKIDEFEIHSD
jgi:predicted phosphodiesterase